MLKKRNEEFMYLYELNSMLRSMSMGIRYGDTFGDVPRGEQAWRLQFTAVCSHSAITQLAVSKSMGSQVGSSGMSKRAAFKLKKERRHSSSMVRAAHDR